MSVLTLRAFVAYKKVKTYLHVTTIFTGCHMPLLQLVLYQSSIYEMVALCTRQQRLLPADKTLNMDHKPAGTRVQYLKNTNSRDTR